MTRPLVWTLRFVAEGFALAARPFDAAGNGLWRLANRLVMRQERARSGSSPEGGPDV